jgi:hypothetical protein
MLSAQERMQTMLDLAKLADDAGLDLIGVGEHHSLRYVNSATATILSAMGALTRRIRLTSAEQVTDKLLAAHEALGLSRYFGQIDIGGEPFSEVAKGIELFATRVAPALRRATEKKAS